VVADPPAPHGVAGIASVEDSVLHALEAAAPDHQPRRLVRGKAEVLVPHGQPLEPDVMDAVRADPLAARVGAADQRLSVARAAPDDGPAGLPALLHRKEAGIGSGMEEEQVAGPGAGLGFREALVGIGRRPGSSPIARYDVADRTA